MLKWQTRVKKLDLNAEMANSCERGCIYLELLCCSIFVLCRFFALFVPFCVYPYTCIYVRVSKWTSLGKQLLTQLTICSLCISTRLSFFFHIGLYGGTLVLISPVPDNCLLLQFYDSVLSFDQF